MNQVNEPNKTAERILVDIYLDWVNNYLTVEKFAAANGLTEYEANQLISLARHVTNRPGIES